MEKTKKSSLIIIILLCIILVALIIGTVMYFNSDGSSTISSNVQYSSTEDLHIDMTSWNYDETNDVYWQIGIVYCSSPETKEYESMGIYVPGQYMTGTKNSDSTYTCVLNEEAVINGYTALNAPIVMPINTAGYSAQAAPTLYSYNGLSEYLEAGYIYVYSGCRGRNNGDDYSGGAPWGVTDLKAAIRYLRYNDEELPGDSESIFTFGHSGGGAQSALVGATGDSSEYTVYLESIGAIMYDDDGEYISDSVKGSMCWCPITSLDYANEAYEWNMGQYATTGTRSTTSWTSALSTDMAVKYAEYINNLGLKDENGNVLTLRESSDGIYTSGSYYDYLLGVIENSLNNFLSDNSFPCTVSSSSQMADGGFGGAGSTQSVKGTTNTSGTIYETPQDYIDSLNADEEWVIYNEETNTVTITSIEAFVTHCKSASKDVGAFDDLNRSQAENYVFGNDESDALHWDKTMAQLLGENATKYKQYDDYDASYISEYENDIASTDKFGTTSQVRQNMYNPMYYLCDWYDGYETSTVAKYWRIRTGITQGDTALTVETNLALALQAYSTVKSVDFETVWAHGHTTAERTGDSTTNFITWVDECMEAK